MYAILVWVFVSLSFPFVLFAETRVPLNPNEITLSFAPVVKRAAPAVVNIYAKRLVNQNRSPFQNDPFFRRFFQNRINPQKRVQNSLGSGVILSEDGYVVSNYHVVRNASDIRVVLNDRRQFTASVALADEKNDLDSLNEFLKVMKDPYKTFPRIEKFQSTPSTKKETYVTYCGT